MELMHNGQVLKTYKIALGGQPVGAKTRQGDHRTPEGVYVIDRRKAHSQFHRALHISYPNAADRQRPRQLGVSPGGDIFIHGLPKDTPGSVRRIAPETGPTDRSPSLIRKLRRFGDWLATARR